MCVDDDPTVLEVLEDYLTQSGFHVLCESDTHRAKQLLAVTEIDAVILDYEMPGCNGLELSKAIHQTKPHLPILMFSGTLLPPDALTCISSFVPKNQGVLALVSALERELSRTSVRGQHHGSQHR
jgi:DNA-binding response OmpR family regulator